MLPGMSSFNPEPGDFTSVLLQCVSLPVSEAGFNRMSDLLVSCGVSVAIKEHAQGIGVSYTSEAFAFTCLIPALGDKYCPVQSGFDDAHFTGLSAPQASVLWLIAQRFSYRLLPGACSKVISRSSRRHIIAGAPALRPWLSERRLSPPHISPATAPAADERLNEPYPACSWLYHPGRCATSMLSEQG